VKRLVRKKGVIFGVCAGLGAYFETDPVLFRILFVIIVLGFGFGILLYIIMAIIMPHENKIPPQL
jgi:phage shock protein C